MRIEEVVSDILKQKSYLPKLDVLREKLTDYDNLQMNNQKLSGLLKTSFGLKFQKVRKVPRAANTDRNLYVRQHYAMKMLDLQAQQYRIINFDETPMMNAIGLTKGWCMKNRHSSAAEQIIWPRVTCIFAIDNTGGGYYSLLQSHSNQVTMKLFLFRLVELLDAEEKGWRDRTYFQIDGASYHKAAGTIAVFKALNLKVVISAPHSFD